MNPYWVIAIIILVLAWSGSLAYWRYRKTGEDTWRMVAILLWILEAQARIARKLAGYKGRK